MFFPTLPLIDIRNKSCSFFVLFFWANHGPRNFGRFDLLCLNFYFGVLTSVPPLPFTLLCTTLFIFDRSVVSLSRLVCHTMTLLYSLALLCSLISFSLSSYLYIYLSIHLSKSGRKTNNSLVLRLKLKCAMQRLLQLSLLLSIYLSI